MSVPVAVQWKSLVYLCINVAHPILTDMLRRNGAIPTITAAHILPIYIGMLFVYALPHPKDKPLREEQWGRATTIGLLDMFHQILEKVGLVYTGSSIYIVLCSSGIVWTSLLSYLILHKRMNFMMALGVWTTFFGLALKGLTVSFTVGSTELIGILLTSAGVMMQSLTYVLSEKLLTDKHSSLEGPNLVFIHGVVNSAILGVWFLAWAGVPGTAQWDHYFTEPIQQHGGSVVVVIFGYSAILVAAIIRSSVLWYLQKHAGAVSVNVLKGARAAVGVFISHSLYCSVEAAQCLSFVKAISAGMCVSGVVLFGFGKKNKMKEEGIDNIPELSSHKSTIRKLS